MYTFFFLLFLSLQLGFIFLSPSRTTATARFVSHRSLAQNGNVSCPLDFDLLRSLLQGSKRSNLDCRYIRHGLRLVQSDYRRRTGSFLPPLDSAELCWDSYQALIDEFVPNFDIRRTCEMETSWIAEGCISTIDDVATSWHQSLDNRSLYDIGNLSDCTAYPSIYAAAFANLFVPTDTGNVKSLLSLNISSSNSNNKQRKIIICVVLISCAVVLFGGFCAFSFLRRRRDKLRKKMKYVRSETSLDSGLESIGRSTTLVRFTFDEIKQATENFSRGNIIGRGGYGNVYKGVLPDGSEVALKRFKNCSEAGDETFGLEVESLASVRHVNLIALRGHCTATTPFEGHQRIIVFDLMKNGSLHDHLFGLMEKKLSWPIRQKIALGTARGLAYLHYGAQPAIIHRDIKASNILLDEGFEPKLADFGLAKFAPEGMTHLSTRVAGTMGYVAPEYALYGQLTERSDVYSFGVVLLELLSGRKALLSLSDNQSTLVADWAWSLVRNGRASEVIEDGIPDLGSTEVMEKYVLVAVLCSHPQLYARPTMDEVVKIFETDLAVPSIPERPIPLIADIEDIERFLSRNGFGHLSTSVGYQPYKFEIDHPSTPKEEGNNSGSR